MIERMTLNGEGFRFFFDNKYGPEQEWMGAVITLQFLPPLQELTVKTRQTDHSFINPDDLRDLITYFEHHMTKLKNNENTDSEVFLTEELNFRIQALEGIVAFPSEEFFWIRCFIKAGLGENGRLVYIGGESSVTFQQVRAFLRDIQTFLDERRNKDS